MNVLLDTHTLIWLLRDPAEIDSEVVEHLSDPSVGLWVSAASAWEIGIKTRLKRLDGEPLLAAWSEMLSDTGIGELAIDSADAIVAARLPWEHRDPFDRMIVAQALRRNHTIATRDAKVIAAALTPTLKA
jgi:PIN domain nuclease of toxin-antitoxin system